MWGLSSCARWGIGGVVTTTTTTTIIIIIIIICPPPLSIYLPSASCGPRPPSARLRRSD